MREASFPTTLIWDSRDPDTGGVTLIDDESRSGLRLGDDRYDDVADYITAFQAAVRTHRQLTDQAPLEVEIDTDAELPLIQRAMLR